MGNVPTDLAAGNHTRRGESSRSSILSWKCDERRFHVDLESYKRKSAATRHFPLLIRIALKTYLSRISHPTSVRSSHDPVLGQTLLQ